jgi:RNA polymerase sigma factor (sigma-70 family)
MQGALLPLPASNSGDRRLGIERLMAPSPIPEVELNALHQRLRPALLAFFMRRVGNLSEAEDLTQETFARLAATQTQMRHADAYVFQIAANLLRDRGRRQVSSAAGLKEIAAAKHASREEIDGERVLLGRERLGAVIAALQELTARTRNIFLLSRLEGLRHGEIANMFGVSESAVRKHLTKAVAHLANRVGEEP